MALAGDLEQSLFALQATNEAARSGQLDHRNEPLYVEQGLLNGQGTVTR